MKEHINTQRGKREEKLFFTKKKKKLIKTEGMIMRESSLCNPQ